MHKRRFSASLERTGDRPSILSSDWSEGRREHSRSLTSSLNEWCGAQRICVLFAVVLFSIKTEGIDDRYDDEEGVWWGWYNKLNPARRKVIIYCDNIEVYLSNARIAQNQKIYQHGNYYT